MTLPKMNAYGVEQDAGLRDQEIVPTRKRSALIAKRFVDIIGASLFFILFGWVFIIVWIGVLFTTGTPATYKHIRIGKNGKQFPCLKFRSMVVNSEEVLRELLLRDEAANKEWLSTFKLRNDPRITKFGRFIRKSSLDELPQFWNVLRGDMSLVGPRPVVQNELNEKYGPAAAYYTAMRPGITGPWQVSGRSDLSYTERISLDMNYVRSWTITGDIKLVFSTVAVVFKSKGSY
jgi:exopolysaccharide production protein ExoY